MSSLAAGHSRPRAGPSRERSEGKPSALAARRRVGGRLAAQAAASASSRRRPRTDRARGGRTARLGAAPAAARRARRRARRRRSAPARARRSRRARARSRARSARPPPPGPRAGRRSRPADRRAGRCRPLGLEQRPQRQQVVGQRLERREPLAAHLEPRQRPGDLALRAASAARPGCRTPAARPPARPGSTSCSRGRPLPPSGTERQRPGVDPRPRHRPERVTRRARTAAARSACGGSGRARPTRAAARRDPGRRSAPRARCGSSASPQTASAGASSSASPRHERRGPRRARSRSSRGRARSPSSGAITVVTRASLVQRLLELVVGGLEPLRVEPELAALLEHATARNARSAASARSRGSAGIRDSPRWRRYASTPSSAAQRAGRRGVGRQRRQHPEPLADERAGQRPVAVQRHPAARTAGRVDHLERDLRARLRSRRTAAIAASAVNASSTPWRVPLRTSAGSPSRAPDPARTNARLQAPSSRAYAERSISLRCATFSTSLASALAPPANHASRISSSSAARRRPQAQREHVRVVPPPRALRGRGVGAQRGADPRHLVRGDRRAGSRPARDDRLLGPAVGHVPGRGLARPRPVGALGVASRRRGGSARGRAGAAHRGAPARRRSAHPRRPRSASRGGQAAATAGSRALVGRVVRARLVAVLDQPLAARTCACPRSAARARGPCRSARTRRAAAPRGTSDARRSPPPRGRAAAATASAG